MKGGPVGQLPDKVWENILIIAIDTPTLPFLSKRHNIGCGILRNIPLTYSVCEVYRENIAINRKITTLRLVCRSWASILTKFCHRCLITDLREFSYPIEMSGGLAIVDRFYIFGHRDKPCSCSSPSEKCILLQGNASCAYKELKWWRRIGDVRVKETIAQVRVLALDNWEFDPRKFLRRMPNLEWFDLTYPAKLIPPHMHLHPGALSSHSQLTHLTLKNLLWKDFGGKFVHTTLRYLDLWFADKDWSDHLRTKLKWSFPLLRTLIVGGLIFTKEKEDLYRFLYACGRTITEFVSTYILTGNGIILGGMPPGDQFPHLRMYGTRIGVILSSDNDGWRNAGQEIASRTLLIYDFSTSFKNAPELVVMQILSYAERWNFEAITIADDWAKLRMSAKEALGQSWTSWAENFFMVFESTGMELSDGKCVDFRDPECQELWS